MNELFLIFVGVIVDSINAVAFIVLTIAMYKLSKQQSIDNERKHRDFFRMQLFDKRYRVFDAIESAVALVERKDFSPLIVSEGLDSNVINKRLIDAQESLHKSAILSQALFRKDVSDRIFQIDEKYNVLVEEFFKIFKQIIMPSAELKNESEAYGRIFAKQMFETEAEKIENLNKEFRKECPYTYSLITEYNSKVAEFSRFVNGSRVLEDFDEYMLLSDIDKR